MKKYLFFFIIAIFMMVNDALSNMLGLNIGLPFWRQLVWVIGMFILVKFIFNKRFKISYIRKVFNHNIVLSIIVLILAFLTLLLNDFNIFRVILASIDYFYGLPFIIFPYICIQNGWRSKKIDYFFIGLSIFLSLGFFIDYMLNGAISLAFQFIVNEDVQMQFQYGRYNFLSTTNTILTMPLCIGLFSCFRNYSNTKSFIMRFLLLFFTAIIIFGSIFSGARQTLAALTIVEVIGMFSIIANSHFGLLKVSFSIILISLFIPIAKEILSNNKGFEERYSSETIKEDDRIKTWKAGVDYCFFNTTPRRALIGEGVGYTLISRAAASEKKGKYYENSFLARISEVGIIIGFITLLLPIFYIIKYHKRRKVNILYYSFLLAYLFICMASPNGLANQSQMALFILLGLFFEDNNIVVSKIIKI